MKMTSQEVKGLIMQETNALKLIMQIDITQWKKRVLFLIKINEFRILFNVQL